MTVILWCLNRIPFDWNFVDVPKFINPAGCLFSTDFR